jgi:hypothetical protein
MLAAREDERVAFELRCDLCTVDFQVGRVAI